MMLNNTFLFKCKDIMWLSLHRRSYMSVKHLIQYIYHMALDDNKIIFKLPFWHENA